MSDLRQLDSFGEGGGDRVGARVVPPDFDRLVTVSRRRRRNSVTASGLAAAAVIAVAALGVHGVYGDQSAPVGPTHTGPPTRSGQPTQTGHPTQTPPTTSQGRADAIIDNPNARRWATAVLPDHPQSLAVMWHVNGKGSALALTSDGFASRTSLLLHGLYPSVSAAGPSSFFVEQQGAGSLVSPDGPNRPVTVTSVPAPLAPGEYLVPWHGRATLAVDPSTAIAHPLTLPAHAHQVYGGQGLVWTIAYPKPGPQEVFHNSLDWSTDGGRTWSSRPLPSGSMVWFDPVSSPPGTMAVTQGGQDVPSLGWLVVSRDSGKTWTAVKAWQHVTAAVGWAATTPDGRLLVGALSWTEGPPGGGGAHHGHLLTSAGTDWTRFAPASTRLPSGEPVDVGYDDLVATSTDGSRFLLYIADDTGPKAGLLVSGDGGSVWTPMRDR